MSNVELKTRSTSPSTVCYTCSNESTAKSGLGRSLAFVLIAVRVFTALVCSAVLTLQSRRLLGSFSAPNGMGTREFENTWADFLLDTVGPEFMAEGKFWWMIPATCALLLWLAMRRNYIEESLLCIRGLGIQTSSSAATYLSGPTTRFIPTSQIQDIFIYEAFIGFEVRFYLAVIVEGEEQAVVVFPKLLPRRELLEEVWRGARAVLAWSKDSV